MPKLNYCWRTTNPLVLHEAANMFQSAIYSTLRSIVVAAKAGFGDFQAQLYFLPLRYGGLGIDDYPHDLFMNRSRG
jgi:hypothetical protein